MGVLGVPPREGMALQLDRKADELLKAQLHLLKTKKRSRKVLARTHIGGPHGYSHGLLTWVVHMVLGGAEPGGAWGCRRQRRFVPPRQRQRQRLR